MVHPVDTSSLPIGRALRVERTLADLSLTAVAEAAGVSIGHLGRIEAGERTASPEIVAKVRAFIRKAQAAAAEPTEATG